MIVWSPLQDRLCLAFQNESLHSSRSRMDLPKFLRRAVRFDFGGRLLSRSHKRFEASDIWVLRRMKDTVFSIFMPNSVGGTVFVIEHGSSVESEVPVLKNFSGYGRFKARLQPWYRVCGRSSSTRCIIPGQSRRWIPAVSHFRTFGCSFWVLYAIVKKVGGACYIPGQSRR